MDSNVTQKSEATNNAKSKDSIMQIIKQTPATEIADLQFVRNRFIQNYNVCNPEKIGDLMYYRQAVHFKQLINSDDKLKNADPFSLYACFITAAVKGYSFDPEDKEIYLLALRGKAYLWRQAGAHVRRLMQTKQIKYADQAKLVYKGDKIVVENGRVIKHIEKFESDEIISGYVRFVLDDKGTDRFFIYRKNDWFEWKRKSPQADGENWTSPGNSGQPNPGFLRTKIIKHACLEKVWAIGTTPPEAAIVIQEIRGFERDDDELDSSSVEKTLMMSSTSSQQPQDQQDQQGQSGLEKFRSNDDEATNDDFGKSNKPNERTVHKGDEEDDF